MDARLSLRGVPLRCDEVNAKVLTQDGEVFEEACGLAVAPFPVGADVDLGGRGLDVILRW